LVHREITNGGACNEDKMLRKQILKRIREQPITTLKSFGARSVRTTAFSGIMIPDLHSEYNYKQDQGDKKIKRRPNSKKMKTFAIYEEQGILSGELSTSTDLCNSLTGF
jgi:hypothetical protein